MAKRLSALTGLKRSMFTAQTAVETTPAPCAAKHAGDEEVLAYFAKRLSKDPIPASAREADREKRRIAELEEALAAKDEILAELAAEKVSAEDCLRSVQEDLVESKKRIGLLEEEIARLKAECAQKGEGNAPVAPPAALQAHAQANREEEPARALLEVSSGIEEVFPGELREIVLSVLKKGCDVAQNAGLERRAAILAQLLGQNASSGELERRKSELRQILKDAGAFADAHTIRALDKIGFRLIGGKKHWKLEYGNVRMSIAKTPSDYRSHLNSANAIANKCF